MNRLPLHLPGLLLVCLALLPGSSSAAPSSADEIRPFLEKYCLECHGGEKVKGKVDFARILASDQSIESQFETWKTVREVLGFEEMPPEDELQPGESEREQVFGWSRKNFVESIEAKPGLFQPRRLSVIEYRNTLHSLMGFDLEVAIIEAEQTVVEKSMVLKLLPTDPRGASGFTNDTRGNPLTTVIWDRYSSLVDVALNELFSRKRRAELEAYIGQVPKSGFTLAEAEKLVSTFVPRAWRREIPEAELEEILAPLKDLESEALVAGLKRELKTVLMAPTFIYRGLLMEGKPGRQMPVDDFELAERLSYFLWADMPDAELLELAAAGTLNEPDILRAQVERLLESPKARSMAEDFAVQWLSLDEIEQISKNKPPYADALRSQPVDFVHYLFSENRPLIELVDSKVTFVNPHTAKFYPKDRGKMTRYVKQKGIEVESVPNQKLVLENAEERGGLLTMPGVLAMNKGPVIRGTWILERILGDHLSDPPPDVGVVAPNQKGENLSFRERFEQHRSREACALCHDRIDPLGFALQGYNDGGAYILKAETAAAAATKKEKKKKHPAPAEKLDTSGQLPSGETFANFKELKELLVTSQRQRIIRNIVERTLSYALCRKLEIYDQPTIDAIAAKLDPNDGTYRDLVHEIVNSLPFRQATFPAEES